MKKNEEFINFKKIITADGSPTLYSININEYYKSKHGALTESNYVFLNNGLDFSLGNAYPNPFNPATTISLTIPNSEFVSVKVFNLMGQEIESLSEGILEAKTHLFTWNASEVPSGVYLIRAESVSNVDIKKVLLVK